MGDDMKVGDDKKKTYTEEHPNGRLPADGTGKVVSRPGRFRAYARLFRIILRTNLRAAAEYRGNFLIQVFGMALNNGAFLFFWSILLERTGDLGGYGIQQILFLWGVGAASFGLGHIVFGNTRQIGRIILTGGLDVYLLQPKDVLLNLVCSRTDLSAWGDLLFGLLVFGYLGWGNPAQFLLLLGFTISGALVYMSVFTIMETLTFYLGNSSALSRSVTELMLTATLYPETIFGTGLRWMFYSLIPTAFIVFIPLRIFESLNWTLLPLVMAAALGYTVLAWLFFQRGLRRYESGNLVGGRV